MNEVQDYQGDNVMKKDTQHLVLAQTVPNTINEAYVVVGILADDTPEELMLVQAVSPTVSASMDVSFQQQLIPNLFIDPEYRQNVVTVLRKEQLIFYVYLNAAEPHPICEQYAKYWAPPAELNEDDDQ